MIHLKSKSLVFFLVFLLSFSGSAFHTFTRPKVYRAEAKASTHHLRFLDVSKPEIVLPEDIYDRVAERILDGNFKDSDRPYPDLINNKPALIRLLQKNDSHSYKSEDGTVVFRYRHDSPKWAAIIANVIVDECVAHDARLRIDKAMTEAQTLQSVISMHQADIHTLTVELAILTDSASKNSSTTINTHEERKKYLQESIHLHQSQHDKLVAELRDFVQSSYGLDTSSARKVDLAKPPNVRAYVSPNVPLRIGMGFSVSLLLALGASFCVGKR